MGREEGAKFNLQSRSSCIFQAQGLGGVLGGVGRTAPPLFTNLQWNWSTCGALVALHTIQFLL